MNLLALIRSRINEGVVGIMHKYLRICLKFLFPILVVAIGGVLTYLYGWRLFGFRFCQSPTSIGVLDVSVSDGHVTITGCTTDSASKFIGYHYNLKNGILRIGLRFGMFAGESGDFKINIQEDNSIEKIVITGSGKEKKIYPADI